MKMVVLVDNIGTEELLGEWGLSIYIEHRGVRWLLDAGQSNLYLRNAKALGINLALVNHAVLSHAHYDHANGFKFFFAINGRADLLVAAGASERCWKIKDGQWEYIGIAQGLLAQAGKRLRRIACLEQIEEGAYILPHATAAFEKTGLSEQMYLRDGEDSMPDDFTHEQSLIFETERGLVVLNSCSHVGADIIVREVMEALPGKPLLSLVGGFHLYNKTENQVRAFAKRLAAMRVESLYTGHCTGMEAFMTLREVMGTKIAHLRTGLVTEF
ncbi:MAG: MBL fold metallo-hydrolase [Desulfovibrio sp.]|nr:MBL fold metallo-hydrolase [Desulfovibrio sp.]